LADEQTSPAGPDLTLGIELPEFTGETLLGHVGREDVLLVRSGSDIFAIDAHCSHYHGPLAEGLVVGESIRCVRKWHETDVPTGPTDVRCWGLNGLRADIAKLTIMTQL
jgi:apoptosis-inducing factor 3